MCGYRWGDLERTMADVQEFFESYLPNRLSEAPEIVESINAVYQFDLGDAGNWTVDLTQPGGAITRGTHDAPGCVVSAKSEHFAKLLDNPDSSMMMFTMGQLKVSNLSLGMQLRKLLG